jgi:hypothetical protein
MNRIGRRLAAVAALVLVIGTASSASAGTPGAWERAESDAGSNLWIPTLLRTGDGLLHVVWGKEVTGGEQYRHLTISSNGAMGSVTNVLPGAHDALHHIPKLVANGDGLRLVSSGLPESTFVQSTSATGASWTALSAASTWDQAYVSNGIGAGTTAAGTPYVGGARGDEIHWHGGTTAGTGNESVTLVGRSLYAFNLGVDQATDQVWGAVSDLDNPGIYAIQLEPSTGTATKAPHSSSGGNALTPAPGQVAIAAPPAGGVYAAYCVGYPTCQRAEVWELGTDRTVVIPGTKNMKELALGPGPGGRLWAVWYRQDTNRVYAARSNAAVTKFGAVQSLGHPSKVDYIWTLAIEGSVGRGDVVVNADTTAGTQPIWHTQVLPGLSLMANDTSWNGDNAKTVTFTVKDAGQAVDAAKVKVGTRSCTTGGAGTCKISFPKLPPGKLTAVATKSGYGKDTLTLKVT